MTKNLLALAFLAFSFSGFAQEKTETVFGKNGLQPVRLTGFWLEGQPFLQRTSFGGNFLSRFSGSFEFNRAFEIGASVERSHDVFAPASQPVRLSWTDGWAVFLGYRFREKKLFHPSVRLSSGIQNADFFDNSTSDFHVFRFAHFQAGFEANLFRWMRFGLLSGYLFSENKASQSLGDLNLDGFTLGAQLRFGILKRED